MIQNKNMTQTKELQLYNTLKRKKQVFVPTDPNRGLKRLVDGMNLRIK